jgi:hypothetical protein
MLPMTFSIDLPVPGVGTSLDEKVIKEKLSTFRQTFQLLQTYSEELK